jgi:hypothetical protein
MGIFRNLIRCQKETRRYHRYCRFHRTYEPTQMESSRGKSAEKPSWFFYGERRKKSRIAASDLDLRRAAGAMIASNVGGRFQQARQAMAIDDRRSSWPMFPLIAKGAGYV